MITVKAIVERSSDGTYSVYMDNDELDYLVTSTGGTVAEAIQNFENSYDEMKSFYEEKGMKFQEVTFNYCYDIASFLSYYSRAFSLAGLSRITGINQGQLSHYVTGHRTPSVRTRNRIQDSIHRFAKELSSAVFV